MRTRHFGCLAGAMLPATAFRTADAARKLMPGIVTRYAGMGLKP